MLRSISAETAGRFRCEVSAEAPSFETVSGHADMTVVRKCHCIQSLHYISFIPSPFCCIYTGHRHCCAAYAPKKSADLTTATPYTFAELPKRGPVIKGGKARYSIGDHVDLNCTSEKSSPATNLTWFINGEIVTRKSVSPYMRNS